MLLLLPLGKPTSFADVLLLLREEAAATRRDC